MKTYSLLLLFALSIGAATVTAKPSPGAKSKRAYSHNSESGRGKTNKAQFRKQNPNSGPLIDLHAHKAGTFKTAKAAPAYKYYNPR